MSIITRMRKQKAVYWAFNAKDDDGMETYGTAVEIDCRWDDVSEEFIDFGGQTLTSKSIVYPDREMFEGDVLKLDEISNIVDVDADPTPDPDVYKVRGFSKIPNFKANETLYIAKL